MTDINFREIPLSEISPNPKNPRKAFTGPKFDELVASIKEKGVIEPIIVRPVNGKKAPFEIVAGERRFKALSQIAAENSGAGQVAIPAIVRKLTDDEAYDFMLIENLQREDLTEREEAESFKAYVARHGEESLPALAEKTGIRPGYIRGRLKVLELPAKVLKLWEKGELAFGHLQQLLRIVSAREKERDELIRWLLQQLKWERTVSVKELASHIDDMAPALGGAFFKTSEICSSCSENSTVQRDLFDIEAKGGHCLNATCFKKRQADWLTENWKTTAIAKKAGTNGFKFSDDVRAHRNINSFYNWLGATAHQPGAKCKSCQSFITVLEISGKVDEEKACAGDKSCYNAVTSDRSAKEKKTGERDPEAPRASWHGTYFRDVFFRKRIHEKIAEADPKAPELEVLKLFCLIKSNRDAREAVAKELKIRDGYMTSHASLDNAILALATDKAAALLPVAIEAGLLEGQVSISEAEGGLGVGGRSRRGAAELLGVDLAKEFSVSEDYLAKKTKAEILAFIRTFKIYAEAKQLMKVCHAGMDPEKLKKSELIELILKSGVDLVGKVPAEILKVKS
jgi:ParB family transcriptional regulator, chromosome partitioning protein